jgi:hypothetical protein
VLCGAKDIDRNHFYREKRGAYHEQKSRTIAGIFYGKEIELLPSTRDDGRIQHRFVPFEYRDTETGAPDGHRYR